jgi:hypothetical protein
MLHVSIFVMCFSVEVVHFLMDAYQLMGTQAAIFGL